MKIGLITDFHANSTEGRTKNIIDTINEIHSTFKQLGVEKVINLGDWNEVPVLSSYNEYICLNHYLKCFKDFTNYFLLGNHDILSGNDLDYSVWKTIKLMNSPRFNIIHDYQEIALLDKKIGLLSYSGNIPNETKVDYLFHHKEIIGMMYPSGKVIENGERTLDTSKGYAKKYCGGHLHIYQQRDHSIYLGATIHKTNDYIPDYNRDKLPGYYTLDLKSGLIDKFINKNSRVNLKYTDKNEINTIICDLNDIQSVYGDMFNVYIRFVYSMPDYDIKIIENRVKKLFSNGVQIEFFKIMSEVNFSESINENISEDQENKNLDTMIINYLNKIDPELIGIYKRIR